MRPPGPRDPIAGPDSGPTTPFPIHLDGEVIKGFGRGSKERVKLGIPTANIPISGLSVGGKDVESGVYFGYASLSRYTPAQTQGKDESGGKEAGEEKSAGVFPMVMSIGWNPYYKNEKRSVEVHILHSFARDFYGARMKVLILGFIRPEYDYVSLESLVDDIKTDIDVSKASLARETYEKHQHEAWLTDFS
ncbi:hypothetical protein ANO11243_064510 [Dothideomycetidae sp. 11243]|nr:hypothetical protein ANO11243_064510 [fungal sp. No.11243]